MMSTIRTAPNSALFLTKSHRIDPKPTLPLPFSSFGPDPGGVLVAVLGPVPELAAVGAAGEHGPVLLALVPEDRLLLALQHLRRHRHRHLDLVRLPLLPGALVEPDFERRKAEGGRRIVIPD